MIENGRKFILDLFTKLWNFLVSFLTHIQYYFLNHSFKLYIFFIFFLPIKNKLSLIIGKCKVLIFNFQDTAESKENAELFAISFCLSLNVIALIDDHFMAADVVNRQLKKFSRKCAEHFSIILPKLLRNEESRNCAKDGLTIINKFVRILIFIKLKLMV